MPDIKRENKRLRNRKNPPSIEKLEQIRELLDLSKDLAEGFPEERSLREVTKMLISEKGIRVLRK